MKFFSRAFTPTNNRRLNELVGFLLLVSALLLFLALGSYSPLDPSFNTAATPLPSRPSRNWIGIAGAYGSDVLLQMAGLAAFLVPLYLATLGARWFRSRKVESPLARVLGAGSLIIFSSALLALLPWHWRWLHAIPIEGLLGRVAGDALIHYFNLTGAYLISLSAIAVALYLSTAFSFGALRLWLETRFAFAFALRDRWQDWRAARAKARAQKELEKRRAQRPMVSTQLVPAKRVPAAPAESARTGIEKEIEAQEEEILPISAVPQPPDSPIPQLPDSAAPESPEVTSRADNEPRKKTTMPRIAGGFKLPSSALLHRPD